MHKFSTAVPQTSTLTALCFLGLLGVLHEYAPAGPCLTRLVIAAPAALRHENLCIFPARKGCRGGGFAPENRLSLMNSNRDQI